MFFKKILHTLLKGGLGVSLLLSLVFSTQITQAGPVTGNLESKLIFYPINKEMSDIRLDLDGKLQDTYFYSRDGIKLNAWYIKAKEDKPTIVYCHGQGENISLWQNVAQFLADNGFGVFMIDYRGHGRSEGCPSETGLYMDLESSITYLKEYEKIPQDNIVLWGRSLGGAVVADVASRDKYRAIILESTFTNIRDAALNMIKTGMLESKAGFWGNMSTKFVKFLPITQTFSTDKKIGKISSPLLIGCSKNDTTIPYTMSNQLASSNSKAHLFISNNGSHHESDWFLPQVLKFLDSVDSTTAIGIQQ